MTFASNYDYLSVTHHRLSNYRDTNVRRLSIDLSLRRIVSLWVSLLRVGLLWINLHARLLHRIRLLGISSGLLVVHLLLRRILTRRVLSWWVHAGLTGRVSSRRVLTRRHLIWRLAGVARLHIT